MHDAIVLNEFEACDIELTASEYTSLRGQYTGRLNIAPTGQSGSYRIHATDCVGQIALPGGRSLVIKPKVAVASLFYMLCVDAGLANFYKTSVHLTRHTEIFTLVLSALIQEVEKVLSGGVCMDYQPRQEDLPMVRGRIALGAQISRYGELRHRHICRYSQLSVDTPENRIVLATLRYASILLNPLTDTGLLHRMRALLHRFEEVYVTKRGAALALLGRVRRHRLNASYWPLLGLCRLLLNGLSLSEGEGPHTFPSFLVNMPRLFESFLTARLTARLPGEGLRVVAQRHDYLDAAKKVGIRPDLLVFGAKSTEPLLVLDAKYKRLDDANGDLNRDLYQVSAYMDRYGLNRGVLVYPGLEHPSSHEVRLLGTAKELHITTLDLSSASSAELEEECARLASFVALLAGPEVGIKRQRSVVGDA